MILITGCGSQSSTGFPPTGPDYAAEYKAAADWTVSTAATGSSLPDGAILAGSNSGFIEPYYANLAAMGLTKNSAYYPQVEAWMKWYLAHLNNPDKWGLKCTVYDYNVSGGVESSTDAADSTDSYAATFVSLAWAYWQTGDAGAQSYIQSIQSEIYCVGNVMGAMQQTNGLTIALPDYPVEYLMDNSEVYRGASDLSQLATAAWGDTATASKYSAMAQTVQSAIQNGLWDASNNDYLTYLQVNPAPQPPTPAPATDWTTWYPDSVGQLYPILYGVIAPTDARATALYAKFNKAWADWPTLGFTDLTKHPGGDPFAWALTGSTAALMGDVPRANEYILSAHQKFETGNFQSQYWYDLEAGWFMRTNAYLLANGKKPL